MNKLFLLGVSLFFLLGDGNTNLFPAWNPRKKIVCAVCQMYKKDGCVKSERTCFTTAENGCSSLTYYTYSKKILDWNFSYAVLECSNNCRETLKLKNWIQVVNYCCREDFCNKEIPFL